MDFVVQLLNTAWFGSLLGLLGIALAVVFFLRGRSRSQLAFQDVGVVLIGDPSGELGKDVTVAFRGFEVPRLSKSTVVFWNVGNKTISGTDIVAVDPLRIEIDRAGLILDVQISRLTRRVNGISARIDVERPYRALVTFDFLDPGDGARVEMLHASAMPFVYVFGTLRGVPAGVVDSGMLPPDRMLDQLMPPGSGRLPRRVVRTIEKTSFLLYGLFSTAFFVAGVLPDTAISLIPALGHVAPSSVLTPGRINWLPLIIGVFITAPVVFIWSIARRRFPQALDLPDKVEREGEGSEERNHALVP